MNERLKELRIHLNLSQEEFGEKISIKSRAHISSLESGSRNLTERIINDICREFKISEDWLRYGIGEMFILTSDDEIDSIGQRYNLDAASKALVKTILECNELERKVLIDVLMKCAKNIKNADIN